MGFTDLLNDAGLTSKFYFYITIEGRWLTISSAEQLAANTLIYRWVRFLRSHTPCAQFHSTIHAKFYMNMMSNIGPCY